MDPLPTGPVGNGTGSMGSGALGSFGERGGLRGGQRSTSRRLLMMEGCRSYPHCARGDPPHRLTMGLPRCLRSGMRSRLARTPPPGSRIMVPLAGRGISPPQGLEVLFAGVGGMPTLHSLLKICPHYGSHVRTHLPSHCNVKPILMVLAIATLCSPAEHWMSTMVKAGVEENPIRCSTVIKACAEARDDARAEHWMSMMLAASINTNTISCTAVIKACACAMDVDRAKHWMHTMLKAGIM